ncbi:D-alanyl-D-alanine endopeptidase [Denitromonas halophila]|uniref:D-alanyl-D-alanine endopeptidase n=1 Tax=Denitromonas halophila TaxID=1629404 RepID=A0A557QG85_9RHOO|nr:D-alanyl-D-alanine endopeptidase [Denitromonas halophila]TVO51918.1 D-alanyl-D-alanine endopeptidase [Denitromonas halophila]
MKPGRLFVACCCAASLICVASAAPPERVSVAKKVATPLLAEAARADSPELRSESFLIVDQRSGEALLARNADRVAPVASITKLMTAMVVLDARQPLSEMLTVTEDDRDRLRKSRSRLPIGSRVSREDLLRLALMSSENRAAAALARYFPGGDKAFARAMNDKARKLGMTRSRFVEGTGLSAGNVSTARDLSLMLKAASGYPLIRQFSTDSHHTVALARGAREFRNTNPLVKDPNWEISLSKTGYIEEAGRCLVMQTWMRGRPVLVVLLDSFGSRTRTADARRLQKWLAQRPWDALVMARKGAAG